jgi:protein-tyrosine-phosphatase
MTIPGFTAESSLFRARTYYYYSLSVKNYYSNSQSIISQTSKLSLIKRWKIPEPQREPAESGRRSWRDLERACNNLNAKNAAKIA